MIKQLDTCISKYFALFFYYLFLYFLLNFFIIYYFYNKLLSFTLLHIFFLVAFNHKSPVNAIETTGEYYFYKNDYNNLTGTRCILYKNNNNKIDGDNRRDQTLNVR